MLTAPLLEEMTAPSPTLPMPSTMPLSPASIPSLVFRLYVLSEILFFLYYRFRLLPLANASLDLDLDPEPEPADYDDDDDDDVRRGQRGRRRRLNRRPSSRPHPAPYRDCGTDRHLLMLRILERIERTCRSAESDGTGTCTGTWTGTGTGNGGGVGDRSGRDANVTRAIAEFLSGWFVSEVEGVTVGELLRGSESGSCDDAAAAGSGRGGGKDEGKEGIIEDADYRRSRRRPPSLQETEGGSSVSNEGSGEGGDGDGDGEASVRNGSSNGTAAQGASSGSSVSAECEGSSGGSSRKARFDASAASARHHHHPPSSSSSSSSSRERVVPAAFFPRRDDMDSFLSWAFFAKHCPSLTPSEFSELEKIYSTLEERHSITFLPGRTKGLVPMRLTLDDVDPLYRPLGVYLFFAMLYMAGCLALNVAGFRFHRAKEGGLTYWHRPGDEGKATATTEEEEEEESPPLPLLFFHGIAPGGLTLYLPMILRGLCRNDDGDGDDGDGDGDDEKSRSGGGGLRSCPPPRKRQRSVLLFENRPISFLPYLEAIDEIDTVRGVLEATQRHLSPREREVGLTVAGHSFGTFQATWMLRSIEFRQRIRQVVIMDPVSVLLSEPDVITNFVYGRRQSLTSAFSAVRPIFLFPLYYLLSLLNSRASALDGDGASSSSSSSPLLRKLSSISSPPKSIPRGKYNKIWMVQSELFIEHYLRRNFWWYNNELFLDAIPHECHTVVCLSGKDEIMSARKVRREVELHLEGMDENASGSGGGGGGNPDGANDENERTKTPGGGGRENWEVLHWSEGGHAHCVPRPEMWREIRGAMRRQEEEILKRA